jgi:hypothetical protein
MILLFPAGSATRNAINIGVLSYWLIRPVLSATKIASRSGPILEMAIFAAPLEVAIAEDEDMHFQAFLLVITMLLIMVIQVSIIQNSDAKYLAYLLIQHVLQVIQIRAAAYAITMEIAPVHTCQD